MLSTMRRHGTTLALFAVLATGLTAVVNELTKDTIAHQAELQQKQLFDQVLPTEMYNNELQHECYVVTDKHLGSATPHHLYLARRDGVPVAAAVESTAPDGYSGAIQLLVAADFSGKVLGVRVLEHHETPGLGDKIDARISDWINSFRNQTVHGDNDPRWFVKDAACLISLPVPPLHHARSSMKYAIRRFSYKRTANVLNPCHAAR